MNSEFDITTTPLETLIPAQPTADPRAGGISFFHGVIRGHNLGHHVKSLEYEADIPLCRREAERILAEAHKKFDIIEVKSMHRIGLLQVGEMAIWVAVSAAHRRDAFDAMEYIVREIKHRLPIWKKEHYTAGDSAWVNCCETGHRHLEPKIYYSRQTNLSLIGHSGQRNLTNAKVLVVGAGGLGNYALIHLVASGVGTVGICEHDTLDVHNLHRQTLYTTNDIQLPKALSAKRRLHQLNPFVDIAVHLEKLTPQNIEDIGRSYDLIIDGTDNFETKFLLNDYCVLNKIPLIQASVYQLEGQITFYRPDQKDAVCLRCTWPQMPAPNCVGNCQEAGVLGFTPGIVGTWQAAEAIKYILGLPVLDANQTLIINLLTNETQLLRQQRNPDCPLCGNSPTLKSLDSCHYKNESFVINPEDLTIEDLHQFILIDIREDHERVNQPFPDTKDHLRFPQQNLLNNAGDIINSQKQYLLICAGGIRSFNVAATLKKKQINNVYSLNRGLSGLMSIMATKE